MEMEMEKTEITMALNTLHACSSEGQKLNYKKHAQLLLPCLCSKKVKSTLSTKQRFVWWCQASVTVVVCGCWCNSRYVQQLLDDDDFYLAVAEVGVNGSALIFAFFFLLLGGELLAQRCRTDDLMPSILSPLPSSVPPCLYSPVSHNWSLGLSTEA